MKKKLNIAIWIITVLPILYFLYLFPDMPEEVPIHFNAKGEADRMGSPITLLLGLVIVLIPTNLLIQFIPSLDPKNKLNENQASFQKLRFALAVFLSALGFAIVHASVFGLEIAVVFSIIWALFIVLGNYLQGIKHNYFIGIRTPYTLEDPEIWKNTHRFGGRIFFYGGIIGLIASFFMTGSQSAILLISFALLAAIASFYYSFKEYKKNS